MPHKWCRTGNGDSALQRNVCLPAATKVYSLPLLAVPDLWVSKARGNGQPEWSCDLRKTNKLLLPLACEHARLLNQSQTQHSEQIYTAFLAVRSVCGWLPVSVETQAENCIFCSFKMIKWTSGKFETAVQACHYYTQELSSSLLH